MWRTSPASARGRAAAAAAVAGSAGGRGIWACGLRLFLAGDIAGTLTTREGPPIGHPTTFAGVRTACVAASSRKRSSSCPILRLLLGRVAFGCPHDCPCDAPKPRLRSQRQPNRLIGEDKEREGYTRKIDDVREAEF